jgi:hypothetical protein
MPDIQDKVALAASSLLSMLQIGWNDADRAQSWSHTRVTEQTQRPKHSGFFAGW